MNKQAYKSNTEPQVGDTVAFLASPDEGKFTVQSVGGGRLGNKVSIVPKDNPKTFAREYYFYCLGKVSWKIIHIFLDMDAKNLFNSFVGHN